MPASTRAAAIACVALAAAAVAPQVAVGRLDASAPRVDVVVTDSGFKVSRAKVPPGALAFHVRNAGTRVHGFAIAGATTGPLKPGATATLRVRLTKPGRVAYVSSVSGRAEPGLKGVLTVRGRTTVTVSEYDFGFKLSRDPVPAGTVVFVMRNDGAILHNFALVDVKVGDFLSPGQTATMTVRLKPGTYVYVCSVKYHAAQGMQGTLTVK